MVFTGPQGLYRTRSIKTITMKRTIIIILLGLIMAGCSVENEQLAESTGFLEVTSGDSRLSIRNRTLYYDGLLFTGKLTEKFNGSVTSVSEYKNGKLDGYQITYYPGGMTKEERYYKNGMKTGEHKGWWESGRLKFVYNYSNDEFDGNVKVWNEAGMLFNDFNYVNGKEEGLQKAWTADGEIQANYFVKENRKYGITGVKDCKTELPQLSH